MAAPCCRVELADARSVPKNAGRIGRYEIESKPQGLLS
jgi:hypothetical protein